MSTRPDPFAPGSSAAWSSATGQPGDAALAPERYARGGELGRGGMGVVEAAVDTWLDRDVAVKRPRADLSPEGLARLMSEARITARLVHPAIPPVYDVGEDELGPFYTMPVLAGATLRERIASDSLRTLVDAVARACHAVGYAHDLGVVHRDLKPDNLLLGAHGEVWVLDWGVAFDPTRPDEADVGTEGYRAPEQRGGLPSTPAADVYSLGVTLGAVVAAHADAPADLRAIVTRCTAADPAARYRDGSVLAQDLERWLEGRLVEAHAYAVRQVLWRAAVRWRAPLAVTGVALVLGVGLGAASLRAQQLERRVADANLSAALAHQAATLLARDARPEAEVLAAHSLRLAENPVARGVWMAWSGAPRPALLGASASPCAEAFVQPDAWTICAGVVALRDPDGEVLWSAQPTAADEERATRLGAVVSARRYGDTVVLRRSMNALEIWRNGALVHASEPLGTSLGLADGPVAALYDSRRVGRLDLDTGGVAWEPESCAGVETALALESAVVVACRDRQVFLGAWGDPGEPVALPGSPSALAWVDGVVVGTFEGDLLTREGDAWKVTRSGVGAPRQLLPLPNGRVAVVGERGQTRLFAVAEHAFVGTLPHGSHAAALTDGALVLPGAETRRYALPDDMRPHVFDRSGEGGVSCFDVSPSGLRLAAGSATGEVVTWEVDTGAARRVVPPGGATAKAVRFDGDEHVLFATPSDGLLRLPLAGGAATPVSSFARVAWRTRAGLALLPWSPSVVLLDPEARVLPLPARGLAVTGTDALWVADERGGVHELEGAGFTERFRLSAPTGVLALSGDRIVVADGAVIEARGPDGALRWRHEGTAVITAIAASEAWIVAGDREGRVLVLTPDGAPLARVVGHSRLVSQLELRGDVLYSASWDGTVRRWGLGALTIPADALVDEATAAWGLGLTEALAGADSW